MARSSPARTAWPRGVAGRVRICSRVSPPRWSRSRWRGGSVSPPAREPRRGSSPPSSPVPSRRRPEHTARCHAVFVTGSATSSLAFVVGYPRTKPVARSALRTWVPTTRTTRVPRDVPHSCRPTTPRFLMTSLTGGAAVDRPVRPVRGPCHQREPSSMRDVEQGTRHDRAAVLVPVGTGAGRAAGLVDAGAVDLADEHLLLDADEDLVGLGDPRPGAGRTEIGPSEHADLDQRAGGAGVAGDDEPAHDLRGMQGSGRARCAGRDGLERGRRRRYGSTPAGWPVSSRSSGACALAVVVGPVEQWGQKLGIRAATAGGAEA
ncbi:hypothetical protein FrEUN1fDRAFT_7094 [Parafrankia sp. EUN1f]|nr:hypothetical protein FrEUN1fDRAFT_7094 [Parafrankia sp. EUN1f]